MLGYSARRGSHGGSMMAADIVKSPQLVVRSPDYDERLAIQIKSEELARSGRLIGSSDGNPVAAKNLFVLDARDALVNIPGGRDGVSLLERGALVVKCQKVGEGQIHSVFLSPRPGFEHAKLF
jgi:hypothetical protein